MAAIFDTSLWGTNTAGTWLTRLSFTIPPASTNTSNSISISLPSGVTLQSIVIPGGTDWASSSLTLTIPSTFTTASSTVTMTLSNGATGSFGLSISGSVQSGVASSLMVNSSCWMSVTAAGQNVTFTGFTPLIQSIPVGGSVSLQDTLFMIPQVTGTDMPDFSFQISNPITAGTVSLTSSSGVSVNNETRTATVNGLGPGGTATVTVTFTPTGQQAMTGTFTIQRLTSSSVSSGSQSALRVAAGGAFVVAIIASDAYLRGNSVQFFAQQDVATDFQFYIATGPITFNSQSVSLENLSSQSTFSSPVPTTGLAQIKDSGTALAQTSFTLAPTNGGTWDPTIINDPDDGPVPVSDSKETET